MRLLVAAVMSPLVKAIVAIKTRPKKLTEGPMNKQCAKQPALFVHEQREIWR